MDRDSQDGQKPDALRRGTRTRETRLLAREPRGSWIRILPGAPVIHEAGHFTQLLSLHESDCVRQPPVTAADDQLVPVQLDLVHQQAQVGLAQA
jgi:hypothetical protein